MDYELDLLERLVALDTDSVEKRNYEAIAKLLKGELQSIGSKTEIINAKAPDGKPRPNVIGYIDNGCEKTLALNAHFDIVPVKGQNWKSDPFKLRIAGGKAFGRGANDDKGNIVAALAAAKGAESNVNLELMFTCDEEVGGAYGLGWVLYRQRKKIRSNYAVVLDTRKHITVGASGVAIGKILIRGKEAHAGYPFLGRNAITTSLGFLTKLQAFDKMAARHVSKYNSTLNKKINSRFSVTMINAGIKENIIPDKLDIRFDMRSIPDMSIHSMVKEFRAHFERIKKETKVDASLSFSAMHNGYATDPRSEIVKKLREVTGKKEAYATFGGDDGTFFSEAGIPVVAYGCGNVSHHNANEYVSLKELYELKDELRKLFLVLG